MINTNYLIENVLQLFDTFQDSFHGPHFIDEESTFSEEVSFKFTWKVGNGRIQT